MFGRPRFDPWPVLSLSVVFCQVTCMCTGNYFLSNLHITVNYCILLSLMFCVQEIDLKAGGGFSVTIGEMCRMMLSKLDWFGTLFPRLPVHVQKDLEEKLRAVKKTMR